MEQIQNYESNTPSNEVLQEIISDYLYQNGITIDAFSDGVNTVKIKDIQEVEEGVLYIKIEDFDKGVYLKYNDGKWTCFSFD